MDWENEAEINSRKTEKTKSKAGDLGRAVEEVTLGGDTGATGLIPSDNAAPNVIGAVKDMITFQHTRKTLS